MFCTKCGAKAQEDKRFCIKCGAELKKVNYPAVGERNVSPAGNGTFNSAVPASMPENMPQNPVSAGNGNKKDILPGIIVGLIVIIIAVVAVVGISMASINIKNRETREPKNSGGHGMVLEKKNDNEAAETPTPVPAVAPTQEPVYDDYYFSDGFKAVRDFEYSYVCPYPQDYTISKKPGGYTFYTDAAGIWIDIAAKPNTAMLSGTNLLNEYKAEIREDALEITYSDSGEKWYAISYRAFDGTICYRKCIINDLNMAYFDVACVGEMLDTASGYINFMEANFKFK